MNEKEKAIQLLETAYSDHSNLETAYSDHSNAVVQIKVEPLYDPIRSDARFQELLNRLPLAR